jgi:hypothetical protein
VFQQAGRINTLVGFIKVCITKMHHIAENVDLKNDVQTKKMVAQFYVWVVEPVV